MSLADSSWGLGWWWLGFMAVCMVMMLLMMGRGSRGSRWLSWCGMGPRQHELHRPEQTLADRLAQGEIDVDEYERRLTALRDTSAAGAPETQSADTPD